MIYAIMLCAAGLNGRCYGGLAGPMSGTFDSPQACLAALPAFGNGKSVASDGRIYITSTTWYECVDTSTSAIVQPQAAAPPKSYTIVMCFKTEAEAKAAAGPGGWQPGDAPCIQMLPAVHEDSALGCVTELLKMGAPGTGFALDAHPNVADQIDAIRLYSPKTRDAWLQCYEITQ